MNIHRIIHHFTSIHRLLDLFIINRQLHSFTSHLDHSFLINHSFLIKELDIINIYFIFSNIIKVSNKYNLFVNLIFTEISKIKYF